MYASPRLTRSIPFWGLVVASVLAIAVGAWVAVSHIDTMTVALAAQTATGVEVYAGQSWVVVGAVILGAGVMGLLLALGIAAIRTIIPAPAAGDLVSATVWADDEWEDEADEPVIVVADSEPAAAEATEAADVHEDGTPEADPDKAPAAR